VVLTPIVVSLLSSFCFAESSAVVAGRGARRGSRELDLYRPRSVAISPGWRFLAAVS